MNSPAFLQENFIVLLVLYFLSKYSPIHNTSRLVDKKQSIACLGVFTMGWPLTLKLVLSSTGHFVIA
jgi:hypothetical protein